MRSFLNSIFILLLAASLAAAQTAPTKPTATKPAEKPPHPDLRIFPRKPRSIRSCISSSAMKRI